MVCALAVNARHMLRLHAAAAAEREGGLLEAWRAEARDAWTGDAPWPRVVHSPRPTPAPSTMQAATEEIDASARGCAGGGRGRGANRWTRSARRPRPSGGDTRSRPSARRPSGASGAKKRWMRSAPRPNARRRRGWRPNARGRRPRRRRGRHNARRRRRRRTATSRGTARRPRRSLRQRRVAGPRDARADADRYEPRDRATPAPVAPPKKASRAVVAVDTKYSVNSTRRAAHAEANALATGKAVPCRARRSQNNTWLGVRVLVTGLSRSGSTWQYNAVKSMLEQYVRRRNLPADEYEVHGAHADGDAAAFDACLSSRICVLKTHIFVPRLVNQVDVILTSHRDVRDVVLSSMLMFGACFAPTGSTRTQRSHGVALRFQQYAHWAPYVCYDAMYERMKLNYTS